jgi:hypothetical protein
LDGPVISHRYLVPEALRETHGRHPATFDLRRAVGQNARRMAWVNTVTIEGGRLDLMTLVPLYGRVEALAKVRACPAMCFSIV